MEILESLLPGKCVSFLILYLLQMIYHFAAIATLFKSSEPSYTKSVLRKNISSYMASKFLWLYWPFMIMNLTNKLTRWITLYTSNLYPWVTSEGKTIILYSRIANILILIISVKLSLAVLAVVWYFNYYTHLILKKRTTMVTPNLVYHP